MQSRSPESIITFPEEAPLPVPDEARGGIETRSGRRFEIRSARPLDMPALRLFLSRITVDDLRFRFLSPVRNIADGLLRQLLGTDHSTTEHFLAFEPGGTAIVASAVIAVDRSGETAEIAICTRPDVKNLGLSWELLKHATDWAARHGVCEVLALEAMDHADAIRLEQEQGFKIDRQQPCPGVLRLSKRLPPRGKASAASG